MSFSTPFASRVISPIANNTRELLDRVPMESEAGWDSLRDTWLVRADAAGEDPSAALDAFSSLDRGQQVSGKNMWIVTRTPKVLASGLFRVEVLSMGLLSARGYKVTYDIASAAQSAGPVAVPNTPGPGSTTYAKVATREGGVSATFEYVVTSSVAPTNADFLTKDTGRAKEPPTGWKPTVPATVWSALSEFVFNYPNGWIFEGATMENLPGLQTVFLVREKYVYQYEKVPG
jgi:hypothetical protein